MATYTTNLNLEKPATSENFNLAKINSNWDKIDDAFSALMKRVYYSTTYSVNAGASINLTGDDFGISNPSGYKAVAVIRFTTGAEKAVVRNLTATNTGSTTVMNILNTGTSNLSNVEATMSILYVKGGFVSG